MSPRKKISRPLRRLILSFQVLFRALIRLIKRSVLWLFRFRPQKLAKKQHKQRRQLTKAGFVLPTATLVLLVVSLLIGGIIVRTGEEAEQSIGEQAQQEIYNAATPAIERGKAKIEFLFRQDNRFPIGIPSEEFINSMMLNDGEKIRKATDSSGSVIDPYTLSDETRLNLNGGGDDNAWSYETDTNGDGTNDTTVKYSITLLTNLDTNGDDEADVTINDANDTKANNLIVRSGPLKAGASNSDATRCQDLATLDSSDGWYMVTGSLFRKNFQINAVVSNNNEANKAVSSLELQQDRDLVTGNKWGAWFRYDLEFTPGPEFNWNGAMHTEGSLLLNNNGGNTTRLRLVSSPASCLYTKEASEITIAENQDPDTGETTFQGQVMRVDTDNYEFGPNNDEVQVDLFPGLNKKPSNGGEKDTLELVLNENANSGEPQDSITPGDGANPAQFMLDPVTLITEGESKARGDDSTNTDVRNSNWDENPIRERIFNDTSPQPYVDDTYRADNRWGPKSQYTEAYPVTSSDNNTNENNNGEPITGGSTKKENLTDIPANVADAKNAGLDGYWERRASVEGMRIIVGQRLNLGNEDGWTPGDSLYPPRPRNNNNTYTNLNDLNLTTTNMTGTTDLHLAAVQSAAVYHWDGYQDEPAACLAMTGHPGNANSTTFNNTTIGGTTYLETDFLNGNGTNGWEFDFYGQAPGSTKDFTNDIDNSSSNLRKALKNLAYFAGDPNGAFPPTQDDNTSGSSNFTHPYPELTMWGDFSNLRRAIDELEESGTSYSDLSLADQTTLQTATCTLGMLAHNLDVERLQFEQDVSSSGLNLQSEGVDFSKLLDGTCSSGNPEIIDPNLYGGGNSGGGNSKGKTCSNALFDGSGWTDDTDNSQSGPNKVPGCGSDPSGFTPGCDEPDVYRLFTANKLLTEAGFSTPEIQDLNALVESIVQGTQIMRDRTNGFARGGPATVPSTISGNNFPYDPTTGLAGPKKVAKQNNVYIRTGCDPDIFGEVTAKGAGKGSNDRAQVGLALVYCRDTLEPQYPSLFYLFPVNNHDHDGASSAGNKQPTDEAYINNSDNYISDSSVNGSYTYDTLSSADISNLALNPRSFNSFVLPTSNSNTGTGNQITTPGGNNRFVSVLDKAIYNDREGMDVRVLDIDLDLLRSNQTGNTENDYWLPTGAPRRNAGIVYAFREDALREDGIARPRNGDWSDCGDEESLTGIDPTTGTATGSPGPGNNCRMLPGKPQDPPLNSDTGISAKAVDGYADPDRRPYGFRLKNGNDLSRSNSDGTGVSFITDQPVYIQGDFNLHQKDNNALSEFNDESKPFYDRKDLNKDFATVSADQWRPTEIIADGITLLSKDFDDQATTNDVNPNPSGDLEINSILVSALSPSLPDQYNGGIHNFPRFLEDWGGTVTIGGAFIQLNFSQYATGPFDQENTDSSNPSDLSDGVKIPYYSPPTRNWGYDVGLQYQPPGPVAERFVSRPTLRTETYRELSADDPYIKNLLNAKSNSSN